MRRSVTALATVAVLLGACAPQNTNYSIPRCNVISDSLILAAQSVPTATKIPCLGALPAGWSRGPFTARDGATTFTLDSDRAGIEAVEVALLRTCNFSSTTGVPSDEPGTVRYDYIGPPEDSYSTIRYYLFDGGCVTQEFEFRGRGRTALIEDVTNALSFVDRSDIRAAIEKQGLRLDP